MLTNGSKYLAHVIAKGVKGDYEPIISWYTELYAYTDHIVHLLKTGSSQNVFPFLLNAFKPGLVSKDPRVAAWAARLISKLGLELSQYPEVRKSSWEWFSDKS